MERGGAIYIDLDIGKYRGTVLYGRGCTFINNRAGEDGGALCSRDNPEYQGAVMLDRCAFRNNEAGEDGGAIVALDDGVVLSNTEITGNTAGEYGGGVFVDARYDINLKGKMTIKDNKCKEDETCNDLALEDGTAATARVSSGGLTQGSWIGIGSTSSGSVRMAKDMSVNEMRYFHPKKGSIGSKNTKTIDVEMVVTASLFAEGNWFMVILFGIMAVVLAVTAIFYGRRLRV